MKVDCNVIKDLLPLYNDNVASEGTKVLVEEHLAQCENCKQYLENIKDDEKDLSIDETKVIKDFEGKIKRKKIIAIVTSIILTLLFIITFFNILDKDNLFIKGYTNGLITVEEKEGELIATINAEKYDYSFCEVILEQNTDGTIDVYLTLFQSLMDRISPKKEAKTVGILPKCFANYIADNLEYNWLWKNNQGKVVLKPLNNVKIANIYYLETMEKYNTIAKSQETVDPYFEMIKIK